jgi:hypothetical protein
LPGAIETLGLALTDLGKRNPMQSSPDYDSFWLVYLAAHRRPATRAIHMTGTAASILLVLAALAFRNVWFLATAVVAGYGFAWLSHGIVERNRPATFRHPLWSIISDFRMLFLWLSGRLDGELARHGIGAGGGSPN